MKNLVTILVIVFTLGLLTFTLSAQDRFDRLATIQADTLDVGGWGHMISGLDIDGDGKMEIYAINTDWNDVPGYDLVPRIYKYEQVTVGDRTAWQTVWSTRLSMDYQNTWGTLASGDLDGDGRQEVVWGPVNNTAGGLNPHPDRIVVFETPGDGSDNMGVDNGDGTWRPNARWDIDTTANANLRPFRWLVSDVDNDGTQEIVAQCRSGADLAQIYSVDDVPDAADSTETWTLEFSGGGTTDYGDLAIIDSSMYFMKYLSGDVVKIVATGPDTYQDRGTIAGVAGTGTWKSAAVVDVDNNGTKEIILASYTPSNDIYLLQESGDSLISTMIADVPSTSYRSQGGAAGDLDGDGNLDYVFGTRASTPNGIIHRLEYQGGAIDDPNNWDLSIIDHGVSPAQQYDVVTVANLDSDPEDEVAYAGIPRGLSASDPPQPITILDLIPGNQPIITDVQDVPNDQGRQVWVIWEGATEDSSLAPPLNNGTIPVAVFGPENVDFPEVQYGGNILDPVRVNPPAGNNRQAVITNYVVWRIDNGLPVQVANVVAIQSDMYAAVVPTLGDGSAWTATYVVSAHTADPLTNWKSFQKSGYSIDNLIPTAPTNLIATPMDPDIQLAWDESPDPDFNYFSIRRGDVSGFDPTDPATEVGTTTAPQFIDGNPGGGTWYYRVVAFDFNGNLGEFSPEVSSTITGIEDEGEALPKEFALYQNYPNPFNPETQIAFDLPTRTDVSITIYNMLGQKVKTLVNETRPAGSHVILWDGSNNQGVKVASGVYIYTIRAGEFLQSRKMTLMK